MDLPPKNQMMATGASRERDTMHKPNDLLERDVREELGWDPDLNDSRIVVKADDGRITLSGAVDTFADVEKASDDAKTVSGVKAIDNELLVGLAGAAITDGEIAAKCSSALDNDRLVPHGAVSAGVIDGVVDLTGEVRHHFQRKAAEHAVGRVPGVLDVIDRISLTDEPIPSDVAERINRAFDRSAVIDGSRIKVSNVGHTIYLDGVVGSWTALDAALDCAWQAPGVKEVVNRIVMIPDDPKGS
jgi:osmotically-inducible protein OsmY